MNKNPIPPSTMLEKYSTSEGYADCYRMAIAGKIDLNEYVFAFYTSPLFKLERMILKRVVGRPSTDLQARELADGSTTTFAAWHTEERSKNEILLCDFMGRTRSWLMIASNDTGRGPGTHLYFGSAIVPTRRQKTGELSLGFVYRALLGFHKVYSVLLLYSAKSRLRSRNQERNLTMTDSFLGKIFEHNNWANEKIIQACLALSDEQLDTQPHSATKGNIRETLIHLVSSQRGYLALLTLPADERPTTPLEFSDLQESARLSGEGLLALANGERKPFETRLTTKNSYSTDPWVVMLQVINHATEHREQIKSMLSALSVTPPDIDGWDYGEATNALIPIAR